MPKGIFPRPRPPARTGTNGIELLSIPRPLEEACKNFEAEAGGRLALVEHLSHARLTDDQEYLVGAIADPRNDMHSLARICDISGVKFIDLLTLFRSAGFVRAQLASMKRVWEKLPDVAEDVMNRSVTHLLRCSRCHGTGVVRRFNGKDKEGEPASKDVECEACGGEGERVVEPEHEVQRTALELGGLIAGKGGPAAIVNVSQQQGLAAGGFGSFTDFSVLSDRVLYPQPQPSEELVEAEIVSRPAGEAGKIDPDAEP